MTAFTVGTATLPGSHQEAAQGLVDPAAAKSTELSNRQLRTPDEGVHPHLLKFSKAFLKDLGKRGFPFYPHCYVRSGELQDELFKSGRTKARAGESPHNWGMAVDIVHFKRHWDLSHKEWAIVGLIGKEVARRGFWDKDARKMVRPKITWGGDWTFYDPAHWELTGWRSLVAESAPVTFRQAFAKARADGLDTFMWNGKPYTTDLA